MYEKIDEAVSYLKKKLPEVPQILVILGSGLGAFVDEIKEPLTIPYKDIPNFPSCSVIGHLGALIHGKIAGHSILVMDGRFHYFEGTSPEEIALPIRVFASLGIKIAVITNACGGIRDSLKPGSFMLIQDHISLLCPPVLRGPNYDRYGPRFPDMSDVYSKRLQELAVQAASENKILLEKGIYFYYPGPNYETFADIRAIRLLGGDAVGMSTVPEVTVACHAGIEVVAISLITNRAAGLTANKLSHEEVIATAKQSTRNFILLLKSLIATL